MLPKSAAPQSRGRKHLSAHTEGINNLPPRKAHRNNSAELIQQKLFKMSLFEKPHRWRARTTADEIARYLPKRSLL